jgi:hypothetical protein
MNPSSFRFCSFRVSGIALLLAVAGCGGGSSTGNTAGTNGGAGTSGSAGTTGGSGTTGTAGTTGGSGTTGTAGTTGGSGTTGTAGTTGGSGATGTAGTTGTGGGTGGGAAGRGGAGGSAVAGTGGSAGGARGGAGGTGGGAAGRGGTTGTGGAATQTSTNVTLFHNNLARTGVYVDAALTRAAVASIHIDTSFANTTIMGPVYAQPLYLGGAGTNQPDMVVVATGQNRVYALNASTGAEVWPNVQFGTPITTPAGTDINSGNRPLNPSGVVGTPVIDPATRTLYFSSYINMSNSARHRIHALDLSNGTEKTGWPVSVENVTNAESGAFKPANQNQRAALAVVGGRLFVPYSGHIGDAGDYHGWVIGVSTTTPTDIVSWATRAACGGIWGTSGIAAEGSSIFFTTGNTKASASGGFSAPSTFGDGESVYKLGTSLARTTTASDFFYPSNWASLDSSDTDVSGSGVQLFDVPGATPSALVLLLAKDGNAYLLNRTNMGGMNASPVRSLKVANGTIIQAPAVYTTAMGTYFVFRGGVSGCPSGSTGGLMAVRVSAASPPAMTPAWCGGPSNASNPMVSMSNAQGADAIVWVVGTNGQLNALNADTGASLLTGTAISLGTVKPHQSPIVANGRVIAASDNRIYALTP